MMMRCTSSSALSLLIVAILCLQLVVGGMTPCHMQSGPGSALLSPYVATFDLDALVADPIGYRQDDPPSTDRPGDTRDFYYYFNFCTNLGGFPITSPPNLCSGSPPVGSAYQIINDTTVGRDVGCHVIGRAENLTWSLIDANNPHLGLMHHYSGGDLCTPTNPRDIFFTFKCTRDVTPVMTTVSEDNPCDYSASVSSIYACPTECVNEQSRTLCGNNGICGTDRSLNVAACFCYSGKGGSDCTTDIGSVGGGSSSKANSVLVAFVIILLVALLIMAVVLYRKIRKLNADDRSYNTLQNDESGARRPVTAADSSEPPKRELVSPEPVRVPAPAAAVPAASDASPSSSPPAVNL